MTTSIQDDQSADELSDHELRAKQLARIRCRYFAASGFDVRDCLLLGRRWDEIDGFRNHWGESWICRTEPIAETGGFDFITEQATDTQLSAIWRSTSGACTAVGQELLYHPNLCASQEGQDWIRMALPDGNIADGIWGLDDQNIFIWTRSYDEAPRLYLWNDCELESIAAPSFYVNAMHGTSKECLIAVGAEGSIAIGGANGWRELSLPGSDFLTDVFALTPERAWAASASGALFECVGNTWNVIAQSQPLSYAPDLRTPLRCVAHWNETVWVGMGGSGLWKLSPHSLTLECVKPEIRAEKFDARKGLLICEAHRVSGTKDGIEFVCAAERALEECRSDVLLLEDFQ